MGLAVFVISVSHFSTGGRFNREAVAGGIGLLFGFVCALAIYVATAYHQAWWCMMIFPVYVVVVSIHFLLQTLRK